MDVRNDCVSLPRSSDRYYRVTIDDVTAEQESELLELTRRLRGGEVAGTTQRVTIKRRPFRIEKIEFWADVETQQAARPRQVPCAIEGFHVEQEPDRRTTTITVDTARQPITSLSLQTSTKNFSRHAAVDALSDKGDGGNWRRLGESMVSRIDFKRLQRENLQITLPESRCDQYRIMIDNRDSRPLEITGITAKRNLYELVFLTSPGRAYRIDYGAGNIAPADYDTTAIHTLLKEGFTPASASLETQVENDEANQTAHWNWSRLANDKRLLLPIMVVLVLVLGWALFQASKRLDRVE
jgi:hypothetical protein